MCTRKLLSLVIKSGLLTSVSSVIRLSVPILLISLFK
jgi:hypothetical protein